MNSCTSVTTELAMMFEKVYALRRRVWFLAFLRVLAGAVWLGCISLLLLGALNLLYPFPASVRLLFLLTHLILIIAGAWFGLRRSTTDRQRLFHRRARAWALHCEELFPGFGNRLVTCVDMAEELGGEKEFEENVVARALLRDTSEKFSAFDPARAVPARRIFQTLFWAVYPFLLLGVLFYLESDWTRRVVGGLYHYKHSVFQSSLLFRSKGRIENLTVKPGDIEVPRGSTVSIEALVEATGLLEPLQPPQLHVLGETGEEETHMMIADAETSGGYRLSLHEITSPTRYQVVAAQPEGALPSKVKSSLYRIEPFDPPEIQAILSTLTPPDYTQLPDEEIEGTYLEGLVGSKVRMTVRSNHPLLSARLIEPEGKAILEGRVVQDTASNEAAFEFEILEKKEYRLEIRDKADHTNADPPLVLVHAREDRPPALGVKRPGADWAVHRLAEVTLEVEARDDTGLEELVWEYRINDGPLTTETLFRAAAGEEAVRERAVSRNLMLEDLHVSVGDSIYYRFLARDRQPDAEKSRSVSQPFFLTVRSFEQTLYKGSPVAGGGGPPAPSQRDVIVATTRLMDALPTLQDAEKASRSEDVARTQRQVRMLVTRLRGLLATATDIPDLPRRLNHLDMAIADMEKAEKWLEETAPATALPPENSALRHQIAALEGLPKMVNWMNSAMPSAFPPPSPTSLSGQKTEFKKDRYELFDAPKGDQLDEELIKALERVREMARRQKEFRETIRREKREEGPPGDPGVRFEEMRGEVENNRQDLERLREEIEQMDGLDRESAEAFRKALENVARDLGKFDQSVRRDDLQQAEADSARVLDELLQLELDLEKAREKTSKGRMEQIASELDKWIQRQEGLKEATDNLARLPSAEQRKERGDVARDQADLAEDAGRGARATAAMGRNDSEKEGRSDLERIGRDLEKAAQWMREASAQVEGSKDRLASTGQEAALNQLKKARKALGDKMKEADGDPKTRLEIALAEIQSLRQAIRSSDSPGEEEGRMGNREGKTGRDQGKSVEKEGSKGKKGSGNQKGSKGKKGSGDQGGGEEGRGDRQSDSGQPSGESEGATARAQTSAPGSGEGGRGGRRRPSAREIRLRIENIQRLIEDEAVLAELLEPLNRKMEDLPTVAYMSPEYIEFLFGLDAPLERLEELLREKADLLDRMQRLKRSPPEDLPPRFREMASRYFEALNQSEGSEKPAERKE